MDTGEGLTVCSMRPAGVVRRAALVAALIGAVLAMTVSVNSFDAKPAGATIGVDDYPNYAANSVDPWMFYARTCTSFVAWRLNNDNHLAFTNGMGGGLFGNATTWADNATRLGYRVDNTPAVGAVAQWSAADMPGGSGYGHVAWVKQVNSDGSVVVEEYNYNQRYTYDQRTTRAARYIHLKDIAAPAPPAVAAPVPFSSWSAFVQRQFLDAAGRAPTSAETTSWTQQLGSGQLDPDSFVKNLVGTGPLPQQLGPVARLYQAYFRRVPDTGGLQYWYGRFRNGMTLSDISASFAQSSEFLSVYGNLDNPAFMTLLYSNTMGRQPDAGGLAYWTGELDSGRRTRGQVLVGFSESAEFVSRTSASTMVTLLYQAMLQRAADPGGWAYWTAYLPSKPNGTEQLVGAIRTSPEYAARVGR